MVKIVEAELKIEVKEDIKAASITANISPLSTVNNTQNQLGCILWQYWLWSFQAGGIKLERFLHKNQHT